MKFTPLHGCAHRWAATRALFERCVPSSIRCVFCLCSMIVPTFIRSKCFPTISQEKIFIRYSLCYTQPQNDSFFWLKYFL